MSVRTRKAEADLTSFCNSGASLLLCPELRVMATSQLKDAQSSIRNCTVKEHFAFRQVSSGGMGRAQRHTASARVRSDEHCISNVNH